MKKNEKNEMSYEEIVKRIIKTRENYSPKNVPSLFKSMTGLKDCCSNHVDILSISLKNDSELREFVLYEKNMINGKTRILKSLLFLREEPIAIIYRKDIREGHLDIIFPSEETEVCYEVYWFGEEKYQKTLEYFSTFSRSSKSKRRILSSKLDANKVINIEDLVPINFKLITYNQITKRTNIYYNDEKVKKTLMSDTWTSVIISTGSIDRKEVKMSELSCYINIEK